MPQHRDRPRIIATVEQDTADRLDAHARSYFGENRSRAVDWCLAVGLAVLDDVAKRPGGVPDPVAALDSYGADQS